VNLLHSHAPISSISSRLTATYTYMYVAAVDQSSGLTAKLGGAAVDQSSGLTAKLGGAAVSLGIDLREAV
jgi:hypothetical protein